ncbi:peptide ABC transporter ATP-binding protein [Mangrovactinospora gilvigrisea]|uniref:Peptide ABC transporter ATP-binding protein n=1 Tax=Mangrovactinospora gilvigrisea TaxID=1428644 RepID=A0A1J7BID1_9ACTN|nr:ABC transporter ATP-binding protein [Mangrovactinospora gilvigrisea]OIV38419.1 peptide ABC transporter ATP-binding protein [Mangrovactinospora gilvigrisea]
MPTKPDTAAASTARDGAEAGEPLIEIEDLKVHFGLGGGGLSRLTGRGAGTVKAVDGVDLTLRKGEVLGLVGESGSGKTTLGRTLLGLNRPTGGHIRYRGLDLAGLSERRMRPMRRELQMVFQDPHASLNPVMDIRTAVGHPLEIHGLAASEEERDAKVVEALERVGLHPAEQFLDKYPSDLSGGQKQRAVLARAIIADPRLLVADEPISMLDMSVRAKILQLMLDLRDDLGLTFVYVTHDLASAKYFCDRIAIMYLGRIVELGTTDEVFAEPRHPYTRALLAAIPEPDPERAVTRNLPRGEVPDAARPPAGCSFHPRCAAALSACGWEARDLRTYLERRWLTLEPDDWARERDLLGDLTGLDTPGLLEAVLRPGRGGTAEDVLALLERLREEDADGEAPEPFWRGVTALELRDGAVRLAFAEPADPRLLPVAGAGTTVACHLHDPARSAAVPPQTPASA